MNINTLEKQPEHIRVVFFGTPEFSIQPLEALLQAGFSVTAVVTQPDKPAGRKHILTPPPIKTWSQEHSLSVVQPEKIKTPEFHQWLRDQKPDVCVVVAYGKIFPQTLLDIPVYGFVNVHPSLLPHLRGASPIPFTVLDKLTQTGVTVMLMDAGMDTGPVLSQTKIDIPQNVTAGWLHQHLWPIGARDLVSSLLQYVNGSLKPQPQPVEGTKSKILDRLDGEMTWQAGPAEIDLRWRAFHPFPGVTILDEGKRYKLLDLALAGDTLVIKKIQPEGKLSMSGADFKRGYGQKIHFPTWVDFQD